MSASSAADLVSATGLLKALLSAAVDAIIVIDAKGHILVFNDSAERLFGHRRDHVLGRNVSMLMPGPYQQEHDTYLRRYEQTQDPRIIGIGREVRALHVNGNEFPIDLAVGEAIVDEQRLYVGIVRDLRQRTYLETQLKQERAKAERLFDLAEVVITAIDSDGRITIQNRRAAALLGTRRVQRQWVECVAADDRKRVGALIERMQRAQSKEISAMEYAIDDGKGAHREFAWQHQWVPPGEAGDPSLILISGVDVTEIHRMAAQLRSSEQRLRQLFDQAPVGILRLDPQGRMVNVNQALCQMLKTDTETLLGQALFNIFKPDSRHQGNSPNPKLDAIAAQSECHGQLRWGDVTLRVTATIGPIRGAGQTTGYILHVVDRSAQLTAEAELDSIRHRLAHAQRLGVMGEMAAGIAHEINQPLSAIASYSDGALRFLANEGDHREKINFALVQIGTQARRAGDVIRRMRALARREESERKSTDLNGLITGLLSLVEPEARHLEAPIRLELSQDLPQVMVDEVQIQQVMLNLIRNALDALAVRSQAQQGLCIRTQAEDDHIIVSVRDHGVGVPENLIDRIFDPFFSSKPSGMGMGLSICATIIRTHGGRLWHDQPQDGGSRFQFTLPITGTNDE